MKKNIKTPIKKGKATPTTTPSKNTPTPKKISNNNNKIVEKKVDTPIAKQPKQQQQQQQQEKPKIDFSMFHKKNRMNNKEEEEKEDTRFNRMLYDPRFRDGEEEEESKIDVTDERFRISDNFFDKHEVDAHGKATKQSAEAFLRDYYGLTSGEITTLQRKKREDEYEEDLDEMEANGTLIRDEEEGEEEEGEEEEGEEGESDEEEEEEDDDDASDESDMGEDIEDVMKRFLAEADEEEEAAIREGEEVVTSRLAVQNMDWSSISAQDILAVLHYFAPPGGSVTRVTVYPSDVGLQAMEREKLYGPDGIWKDTSNEHGVKKRNQGIDEHKLRRYEKNVLRYYYAVVECDSARTASHIYEHCDGMEFQDSVNTLDLRFVPDDMLFKNPPRDSATKLQGDYKPPSVFTTKALGHSVQQLSWDKADPLRNQLLLTDFSKKQLRDMDYDTFSQVINDDDDEDDDDDDEEENNGAEEAVEEVAEESGKKGKKGKIETIVTNGKTNGKKSAEDRKQMQRNKYLGLLEGLQDSKQPKKELQITFDSTFDMPNMSDDEEDESMDREMTFTPGLEDKAQQIMKDKKFSEKTAWDQYLEKRHEKLKAVHAAKKERAKEAKAETIKAIKEANSKSKKKTETADDKRKKAELELMLAGDTKDEDLGFNIRQLQEEEKNKDRKKKKEKKTKEEKREQDFELDTTDTRFVNKLANDPKFAIDRNDPAYKKTAGTKALEQEVTKRRYDENTGERRVVKKQQEEERERSVHEIAASIKRKASNPKFPQAKHIKK